MIQQNIRQQPVHCSDYSTMNVCIHLASINKLTPHTLSQSTMISQCFNFIWCWLTLWLKIPWVKPSDPPLANIISEGRAILSRRRDVSDDEMKCFMEMLQKQHCQLLNRIIATEKETLQCIKFQRLVENYSNEYTSLNDQLNIILFIQSTNYSSLLYQKDGNSNITTRVILQQRRALRKLRTMRNSVNLCENNPDTGLMTMDDEAVTFRFKNERLTNFFGSFGLKKIHFLLHEPLNIIKSIVKKRDMLSDDNPEIIIFDDICSRLFKVKQVHVSKLKALVLKLTIKSNADDGVWVRKDKVERKQPIFRLEEINKKFRPTELFRQVLESVSDEPKETVTYNEACRLVDLYLKKHKRRFQNKRFIGLYNVEKDKLSEAFQVKSFGKSQINLLVGKCLHETGQ